MYLKHPTRSRVGLNRADNHIAEASGCWTGGESQTSSSSVRTVHEKATAWNGDGGTASNACLHIRTICYACSTPSLDQFDLIEQSLLQASRNKRRIQRLKFKQLKGDVMCSASEKQQIRGASPMNYEVCLCVACVRA